MNRKQRRAQQKSDPARAQPPGASVQALFAAACGHHQAGSLAAAEALYRQVLAQDPRHLESQHLLGVIANQQGRHQEAIALIGKAIALNDKAAPLHLNMATALWRAGQRDQALASYQRGLALQPNLAGAYNDMGMLLSELGRTEEALAAWRRAVELKPDLPEAHDNLGSGLRQAGQWEDSAAAHRRALELQPNFVGARYNLGNVLHDLGRLEEATACFRQVIALKPDLAEAHTNLGLLLRELGCPEEAVASCRRAIALQPGNAQAYNNLGTALEQLARPEEAETNYRKAIALAPDMAEAYSNLGNTLQRLGRREEVLACYRKALALEPDYTDAGSNLQMGLHYGAGSSPEQSLTEARRFAAGVERFAPPQHANMPDPERRLRIGYVSANFYRHPIGYFLLPSLACHDRDQFELFCYSNNPCVDDLTRQMQGAAEHWRSLMGVRDEQAAALIMADGIDILVDLSGHTERNRLPLFARKAAPVQASWLGYWATTGLSTIDYILSDRVTVPPGEERWYSEEVVRLEGGRFCYAPPDYAAEPAAQPPSVRNGTVTFGSFNNLAKVGPEVMRLWASVLASVPGSRLLVKWLSLVEEATRARVTAMFADAGIAADRLELRSGTPHREMLAEYGDVDVALDTFPFSGGLTSCEALWMGVPVVTLPRQNAPSRQTLGFLQAIGKPEWAASSPEDYVRIAAALAADESHRAALRRQLRPLMAASPLCDAPLFTRRLETAYRQIWRRWCAVQTRQA
jgi:protein O-GlcNAc transferase